MGHTGPHTPTLHGPRRATVAQKLSTHTPYCAMRTTGSPGETRNAPVVAHRSRVLAQPMSTDSPDRESGHDSTAQTANSTLVDTPDVSPSGGMAVVPDDLPDGSRAETVTLDDGRRADRVGVALPSDDCARSATGAEVVVQYDSVNGYVSVSLAVNAPHARPVAAVAMAPAEADDLANSVADGDPRVAPDASVSAAQAGVQAAGDGEPRSWRCDCGNIRLGSIYGETLRLRLQAGDGVPRSCVGVVVDHDDRPEFGAALREAAVGARGGDP